MRYGLLSICSFLVLFNPVIAQWAEPAVQATEAAEEEDSNGTVESVSLLPEEAEEDANEAVVSTEASGAACERDPIPFNPFRHKQVYTVGVHAIRGLEAAYGETYQTFGEYLTETAGKKFDPPIEFQVKSKYFGGIFDAINEDELDFLYANPGVYSCIGTEVGATSLVTSIKRLTVRDKTFELDVYGGVIAVRADNDEINTILDLTNKIVGAGAIIDLMAGQMQIYEMFRAGMSYVNDPQQVVFAKNQDDVVKGVLSGRFDVGFLRTNQIEVTVDDNGNAVDPALFKIIEPKIFVMDNGDLFPFLHSTDIFPEWPLASLPTVPEDVVEEVQLALLDYGNYARTGQALEECEDISACKSKDPLDVYSEAPCGATWEVAELARNASLTGMFAGFRPSRSYFDLRTMQEKAGFLVQDEHEDWYCTRPSNLYEGITCPVGFFRRDETEFANGCTEMGLECEEGYDCFCKPCVRAFDCDVYEHKDGEEDKHLVEYYGDELPGCEKMSICGVVEQNEPIKLRIYDNKMRDEAKVTVTVHAGDETRELDVKQLEGTYAYEFTVSDSMVQVQVVDIKVNGEPITQSPIRVMVKEANCTQVGAHRIADEEGTCICKGNTYEMGDTCVESQYFFLMIFACVFAFLGVVVCFFLAYKKNQSDSVWHVNVDELHFNEPPDIIGSGAFGVVVLGQYRGTKVAVKRVLPPEKKNKNGDMRASGSMTGSFEMTTESMDKRNKGAKKGHKDAGDSKGVKFESKDKKGDIEAGVKSKTSDSMSLSNWENLLVDDTRYNSAIKILDSATMSNHGSGSFEARAFQSNRSSIAYFLPFWMRFDEHSRLRREFINEMRLLSRLRHPCITTVMGAVICPSVDPMLVMEFMEYGSLHDLLRNETMYAGGEIILQIIRDVSQGIQFLHASKPPILHGDLKAKNILVDSRFRAKVADFGFSHFKTAKVKNVLQGTPFFMAPEYLRRKSDYTTQCDIYSFGMILYEIYARADPFEGEDPRVILPKVCHPRINKRPPVPEACPPKIAEIMKKCWSANPFFRPSAKDIDYILVEMSSKDTEPIADTKQETFKDGLKKKTLSLYDVFPKHIADALNAGKRVEPESHEIVTVVFSDIVGFTTISQTFTPMKVSIMLDRLYHAFDELAGKHNVFKVETIGDAYMGVTNLDGSQFDTHVKHVAEYAIDIVEAASKILIDEDEPEKGTVQIRVGFHSGPVVSNVIGSLNPRYGLFGDTVNTASRMESNSMVGRIHCTHASAKLLETQAPELPVTLRGKIKVKGKGTMMTYWVGTDIKRPTLASVDDMSDHSEAVPKLAPGEVGQLLDSLRNLGDDDDDELGSSAHTKDTEWSSISGTKSQDENVLNCDDTERKINAVSDVLTGLLKKVIAARPVANAKRSPMDDQIVGALEKYIGTDKSLLDEAAEYYHAPPKKEAAERDFNSVAIPQAVQHQLRSYAETIASLHSRKNVFHDFNHATHAVLAAQRLLSRVESADDSSTSFTGLDNLAQFAICFATLIHDVDHRGIPNFCLAKEDPEMNERYHGKALLEQNSLQVGWDVLMRPEYNELRACIYVNQEELMRFRQVLVKAVIATEIFDPDLTKARSDRWQEAFGGDQNEGAEDRKTSVVLDHLMQTCDVAHTMQRWDVYVKWNQKLLRELYSAFRMDRFPNDPSTQWYENELKFFDNYVIPLADKMKECGVFSGGGEDFFQHARKNRARWAKEGQSVVNATMAKARMAEVPQSISSVETPVSLV